MLKVFRLFNKRLGRRTAGVYAIGVAAATAVEFFWAKNLSVFWELLVIGSVGLMGVMGLAAVFAIEYRYNKEEYTEDYQARTPLLVLFSFSAILFLISGISIVEAINFHPNQALDAGILLGALLFITIAVVAAMVQYEKKISLNMIDLLPANNPSDRDKATFKIKTSRIGFSSPREIDFADAKDVLNKNISADTREITLVVQDGEVNKYVRQLRRISIYILSEKKPGRLIYQPAAGYKGFVFEKSLPSDGRQYYKLETRDMLFRYGATKEERKLYLKHVFRLANRSELMRHVDEMIVQPPQKKDGDEAKRLFDDIIQCLEKTGYEHTKTSHYAIFAKKGLPVPKQKFEAEGSPSTQNLTTNLLSDDLGSEASTSSSRSSASDKGSEAATADDSENAQMIDAQQRVHALVKLKAARNLHLFTHPDRGWPDLDEFSLIDSAYKEIIELIEKGYGWHGLLSAMFTDYRRASREISAVAIVLNFSDAELDYYEGELLANTAPDLVLQETHEALRVLKNNVTQITSAQNNENRDGYASEERSRDQEKTRVTKMLSDADQELRSIRKELNGLRNTNQSYLETTINGLPVFGKLSNGKASLSEIIELKKECQYIIDDLPGFHKQVQYIGERLGTIRSQIQELTYHSFDGESLVKASWGVFERLKKSFEIVFNMHAELSASYFKIKPYMQALEKATSTSTGHLTADAYETVVGNDASQASQTQSDLFAKKRV